ncbi:MAG: NotI family restriction endonuclease [Roseiflexus sp.]|nr:NotI family restriction endonuclease [Roseiflexus sp.]MDW8144843.1 NotI family restriction endonuclease [Roseiflexaceae bacterium]
MQYHENEPVITCPVRFRQDWIIADHAASFFFQEGAKWTSLTEVRLNDATGKSAGNIDVVLVAYDDSGKVIDFGALEIQAVYISGNVREPFEYYMSDPQSRASMDWSKEPNYPRPDYLSSSRKRLVPQLVYKGGILHSWKKKIAVALNRSFFATLPALKQVPKGEADITWLIYDLKLHTEEDPGPGRYYLTKVDEVFTEFEPALLSITTPLPGKMEDFIKLLQEKLDEQLETPPMNQTIERPF